jgi:glycosyltransferase involved in cell wall biosynthesis
MKIGFDISQTGANKAGCGYLAYSLIRALAQIDKQNQYVQYPSFGDFYFDPDWKKSIQFVGEKNFQKGLFHRNLNELKIFWNNPPSDFEEKLGNPDIIHSNNYYCPVGLEHAKLVYFLHDLLFLQEPDMTTETNRIGCFHGVFRASLYADHIITNSQFTRQAFLDTFPHFPADKITVIQLASRFQGLYDDPIAKPEGLESLVKDQYWLNVGTLEPRKNQIGLLNAYSMLKSDVGKTYPLVIAGGKGWLLDHFKDVVEELGLEEDIILLGYVDDIQLQWLYKNCFAFVFPAFAEGFGLPVLEAMSLGAAVIASNTTSLPEVVGDAGILVDPEDVKVICESMAHFTNGDVNRDKIKDKALERSTNFSWIKSAEFILDIYRSLLKDSK